MRENAKEKEHEQERESNKNGVTLLEWPCLHCLLHVDVAPLPLVQACGGGPPFLVALLLRLLIYGILYTILLF